ncbi:MAG: DUF5058 family protein [Firmicutes bacterium]|nr:DUF5058 family protein [Bacillota bacterium]
MSAIKSMNPTLWIFAAILIALVLVQSFLFLRLALRFNDKHKLLKKEEIKSAVRTGSIAAIGPSISSIVVALSLIAMVGSATTFMRCGVIGAPGWELLMANIAAGTAGVDFNSEGFTTAVFTFCLFCMVLGSAPYFLNTFIMLKPMDKMVEKSKKKNAKLSFMPYLSASAMFGLLTYSLFDQYKGIPSLVALVAAFIGYYLFNKLAKKVGSNLMGSFSLAVAMVVGMFFGQLTSSLIA